jgi:acyl-homoserine-lactone acylase
MLRVLKIIAFIFIALGAASMLWEPMATEQPGGPPSRAYDARIVRDEFGVPHIFGKTDADTAYGLAYAHSEDDFSTIQEVIAMTRARTGAMIGRDGAKVDYVAHLLGVRATAARDYPTIPADVRAMLDAYAAGLNRFAARYPNEVRLRKLFPVNGEDVLTGFILRAPFFYGLDSVIGALDGNKPLPIETAAAMTPAGREPEINGSNAFAVAPKRMADGRTWLVSNSHQPYEGSVAWYEAAVHSGEGLDMAGALFPGSPFILLGHNRNLGWTNTVNQPDLIDVYKLTLSADESKYKFDGKWLPLEAQRVWLAVRFGPFTLPIPKTVYRVVHGPVIRNKSGAYAIRYAGIDNAKAVEQYYRNTKAQNWDQWSRSMSIGGIPATNFIYADRTGRIAYVYNALFPPRKSGFDYTKVLTGDTSANLWSGSLGFDRMPKVVDPASGFVTNENNSPFIAAGSGSELDPKDFSPLLGIERRVTNRTVRAIEMLSADTSITPEELLAIKFDTAYSRSGYAGPWMAKIATANLNDDPALVKAQALLATWDWSSDGKGGADALAELVLRDANGTNYRGEPLPDVRDSLHKAVDHLTKYFGRIDPPLFAIQRLRRGNVDLPTDGGTDALRATTRWDKASDGRGRIKHGDSFIMLVNWDKAGRVTSRSIMPYGAATTRPESPHYTDQMALFVKHQFKPVHFDRADLAAHAVRAYRP